MMFFLKVCSFVKRLNARTNKISINYPKIINNNRAICTSKYLLVDDKNATNYQPIYKYQGIKFFAIFNKMKIYHGILSVVAASVTGLLHQLGFIGNEWIITSAGIGITGTLTLFIVSAVTKNVVGFIYIDELKNTIKIAYADFWGRRKEIIMPVNDIVPLSELPRTKINMFYVTLRKYSENEIKLKLFTVHAEILNRNVFLQVLGHFN